MSAIYCNPRSPSTALLCVSLCGSLRSHFFSPLLHPLPPSDASNFLQLFSSSAAPFSIAEIERVSAFKTQMQQQCCGSCDLEKLHHPNEQKMHWYLHGTQYKNISRITLLQFRCIYRPNSKRWIEKK